MNVAQGGWWSDHLGNFTSQWNRLGNEMMSMMVGRWWQRACKEHRQRINKTAIAITLLWLFSLSTEKVIFNEIIHQWGNICRDYVFCLQSLNRICDYLWIFVSHFLETAGEYCFVCIATKNNAHKEQHIVKNNEEQLLNFLIKSEEMSGWIDPLIFEYPFDWEGKTCARTFASCTYACCASLQAAHPDAMKSIPRCALVASTCFNQNRKLPGAHIFEKPLPIFTLEKLPSCVLYGGEPNWALGKSANCKTPHPKKNCAWYLHRRLMAGFGSGFCQSLKKKQSVALRSWHGDCLLRAFSVNTHQTPGSASFFKMLHPSDDVFSSPTSSMLRDTFCCIKKYRQAHMHIFTGHLSVHENEVGDDERSSNSFGNDQRIHHCHQMVVVLPITWKER